MKLSALMITASFVGACVTDTDTDTDNVDESTTQQDSELAPKHPHHVHNGAGHGGGKTNNITYHNGPVMTAGANVHYIWYGNWSGNSATTILTDLANGMGGSPYWGINQTYYNGSNVHVSSAVTFAGSSNDNYSQGTALSDTAIKNIVAATNPTDTNAIYFVLTSADVNATSGFCTQYCGWHTHASIGGKDIKYAFVGNPDRCPSACAMQTVGPNGNAGADGMASIISHELEEAVSDPDLNAWYDRSGAENADKCAWTFGTTYTANGAMANMNLGGRNFLIQRNWNASTQRCERVLGSTN